jgi:hypothetical protein
MSACYALLIDFSMCVMKLVIIEQIDMSRSNAMIKPQDFDSLSCFESLIIAARMRISSRYTLVIDFSM